ncbi:MAG: hypothetical protein HWD59_01810 [Coxiellaceae bacterium]|nr:MAG: hypothetical protein HWD59_01810 [Coxiellaceae bacterium]
MPNNNLGLAKLGAQAMAATNVTEIKRLYDGSESARLAFAGSALACGVDIKNIGGDIKTDKEKQWQRIFDIKRRRKPKPPEIDPVTKQRKLELSADAQLFEGDYRFDFAQLYIDLGNEPDHETLRTMVLKSLDFEQIGAMIKKLKADATAWNSFNSQLSQLYSNTTKKADFIKQIILVDATLRIDFFIDLTAVQQAKIYNLYVPSPAFSDATALYKQLSTRGTVITRHNALVTVITNMNVAEITALINNKSALGLNLDETINAIADAMTQKTDAECTAIINHLKTNITKDSRKTATLAKIFSKLSPKQKEDMVKTGTTDTMAVLFYAALTTNDDKKAYIKELLKSGKAAQINTITDPNVTNTFLPQILRENPQINVAPLYIHYGTSTPPDTAKQTALLLALDITQHFALFKSLSPTQRVAYLKLMLSADSMKFLDLVVHIHNKNNLLFCQIQQC